MRQLWKTIGLTSGARLYGVAAGAVSLLITARILGPEGRGFVAVASTWALMFSTVGYLSLGQVALHRGAGKHHSEWLGSSLGVLLATAGIVSVISWAIATGVYFASNGDAYGRIPTYALVLGFATVPFLVWEQYGSLLLTAVGRLSIYNRAQVLGRTVGLVLVIILVGLLGAGVAGALVALLMAQLIVAAAGIRHLLRMAGPTLSVDRSTFKDLLGGGFRLHANALGTFMYTSAAVLIVQALEGPEQTGVFQLAVQISAMALLVPRGASMALYQEVAREGPDAAWPANRKVLLVLSGAMVIVALVGLLLAPPLVPLIFGEDFEGAVPVFQILVCALVGQTFSLTMAPQWIGRGFFWQASLITVVLGVLNVAACFFLVDAYGMIGAAWALLGIYVVSVFGNGALAVWIERRLGRGGAFARTAEEEDRDRDAMQ